MGEQMTTHLADEIKKIWFTKGNLFLTKNIGDLNTTLESELKKFKKSPKSPFPAVLMGHSTKGGDPLLVFKWGQNTIFLEESVKHFLKHKSDEKLLTRQSVWWKEKKGVM
jgi:hypothetical protein